MLARMWLKLLTMGSKTGEKVKVERRSEGQEGMVGLETSQTRCSQCETWKHQRQKQSEILLTQQFLVVAASVGQGVDWCVGMEDKVKEPQGWEDG